MSHRKWLLCLFLATDLFADPLSRARVTKSEGEVVFFGGTAVKTGPKSRAGLEFNDDSVVRLGSNADFSFVPGSRQMSLQSGALLFSSNGGAATVVTGSVTVTGANIQMANTGGRVKAICLSGKAQVSLAGKSTTLKSGDMVDIPSGAKTIPEKSTINLRTLVSTSVLMNMGGSLPGQKVIGRTMRMQSPQPMPAPMVNKNDNVPPPPLIATSRASGAAIATEQIVAQQQAQQVAAQLAAQQALADQAAARAQLANARAAQQRAQQQQAAIAQQQQAQKQQQEAAARTAQQQAAARATQGNQGQGPQGNQGNAFGPQGNQGQGNQGQGNQGQGQGNQGQGGGQGRQ